MLTYPAQTLSLVHQKLKKWLLKKILRLVSLLNFGSWWWTGRPGMLRFMGSQRVGHVERKLNWKSVHDWNSVSQNWKLDTLNWKNWDNPRNALLLPLAENYDPTYFEQIPFMLIRMIWAIASALHFYSSLPAKACLRGQSPSLSPCKYTVVARAAGNLLIALCLSRWCNFPSEWDRFRIPGWRENKTKQNLNQASRLSFSRGFLRPAGNSSLL